MYGGVNVIWCLNRLTWYSIIGYIQCSQLVCCSMTVDRNELQRRHKLSRVSNEPRSFQQTNKYCNINGWNIPTGIEILHKVAKCCSQALLNDTKLKALLQAHVSILMNPNSCFLDKLKKKLDFKFRLLKKMWWFFFSILPAALPRSIGAWKYCTWIYNAARVQYFLKEESCDAYSKETCLVEHSWTTDSYINLERRDWEELMMV